MELLNSTGETPRRQTRPLTACYHGPVGQIRLTRCAESTSAALDAFHVISDAALPAASSADLIAHFARAT